MKLYSHTGLTPAAIFSSPGRTELGGNHTDHQGGHVLASAVTLSLRAEAAITDDGRVRVYSQGHAPVDVALSELDPRPDERGTSAALVRGVAAALHRRGAAFGKSGLALAVDGDLPEGLGLSSSAAYELLVAVAMDELLCGGRFTAVERAQAAQEAENVYFGKPCGLMDQLACAVGGVVAVDFGPETPRVERLTLDLEEVGYALYLVYSGSSHEDLTADYAAVTDEMRAVAGFFGATRLRDVDELAVVGAVSRLREAVGDRAVLRALHFYAEDRRAVREARAVREGDIANFLALVRESGRSSAMYLQNLVPQGSVLHQPMLLTQALCEHALLPRGAVRVHGGGFAGAVEAFVPLDMEEHFLRALKGYEKTRLSLCSTGAQRIE